MNEFKFKCGDFEKHKAAEFKMVVLHVMEETLSNTIVVGTIH